MISSVVQSFLAHAAGVNVRLICIEKDSLIASILKENIARFDFAEVRHGAFMEHVDEIESIARDCSVFLYLDPFAVKGLDWSSLTRLCGMITKGDYSIELLLNFNGPAVTRLCRSSLAGSIDPTSLDRELGGQWWRSIATGERWGKAVDEITSGFCGMLKRQFAEVVYHGVKQKPMDAAPKYALVFATRYTPALKLINDAAARSREQFEESTKPEMPSLFELRPIDVVPDATKLPRELRRLLQSPMKRSQLIQDVMRDNFGDFSETQIRQAITTLLKNGVFRSTSGRSRINDDEKIFPAT